MTHFICQTDLKPSSVTNGRNGAITPSFTPTMQARCDNAGKWVRWGMGGGRMETYDGPVSRLTSTLCGESATRLGLGTWDWNGVVTVSSTGAKNLLQGDDNGHVGRPCEVYQPFGIVPCVCVWMDTMWRSHCLLYKCEADTVW